MARSSPHARPARTLTPRAGHIILLAVILLAPALVASAKSQATLVKDIYPGRDASAFSTPDKFVVIGDSTFFIADDSSNGRELWRTDGTEAGTVLVKDLWPGTGSLFNQPHYGSPNLLQVNGTLFFSDQGQLWKSDGTAPGTVLMKEFNVPSNPATITTLAGVGARIFFVTSQSNSVFHLWVSDGTPSGTVQVKELKPLSTMPQLVDLNGTLFFSDANQLWRSDGTPAGTVIVVNAAPKNLRTALGSLFFNTNNNGVTWWKSDGTAAGTIPIASVLPYEMVEVEGRLFFESSQALWTSDGTAAGTAKVSNAPFSPYGLTNLGGKLLFSAEAGLWTSDGTAAGTVRVKDLRPEWDGYYFNSFTVVGDRLFFVTDDRIEDDLGGNNWGAILWTSDGTEAGTTIVKSTAGYAPQNLINANGTLLFAAELDDTGLELWRSDGTTAGTTRVKNINTSQQGSAPRSMAEINGALLFTADGSAGRELWKTDGSEAGTVLLKDIYPGGPGSYPQQLTTVNGTLFFVATEPSGGKELWKTDGTAAGTVRVKDIMPGVDGSTPVWLTGLGDTLFFVAYDPAHGRELWKTDGTEAGTQRVVDINPGLANTNPASLVAFQGHLYFSAQDGVHGRELWRSDGTAAGTALFADVLPGAASAEVGCLAAVSGMLFFCARDTGVDQRLWKSDGTAAGTVFLADIGPDAAGPQLDGFMRVGGALVFFAQRSDGAWALWRSDGTAAGTTLLSPLTSWTFANLPSGLYFSADDGATGMELWRSDGTAAGTARIADIAPGPDSSMPGGFVQLSDDAILFTATGTTSGRELWRSDGTTSGTVQVLDLAPGAGSSSALALAVSDGQVFISANDGTHGEELWSAPVADLDVSALAPLNDSLTTRVNQPVSGTLRAQGTGAAPPTFQVVAQGRKGTATVTNPATGAFTYAPDPDASGADSFSFQVTYGGRESGLATISINIVTTPPGAARLDVAAVGDRALRGTLPAFDPDGQPLRYALVARGSQGRATITNPATGAFTYTPQPGATGTDEFTFQASDGVAVSGPATVRVTIGAPTAANHPPVAHSTTIIVNAGQAMSGSLPAADADGQPLTYWIVRNGSQGTAALSDAEAGTFTYTPRSAAGGEDSFTFQVSDGGASSNIATVRITAAGAPGALAAGDLSVAVRLHGSVSGTLPGSGLSGPATYRIVRGGTQGTVTITDAASGAFSYTPIAGARGADSFTYVISDGARESNEGRVVVAIQGFYVFLPVAGK